MIKFCLFLVGLFLSTVLVTFIQANIAFTHHIKPQEGVGDIYQRYADAISQIADPDIPLVVVIPLNGFPEDTNHPSYKNAKVAYEILGKVTHPDKYLLLSEGYTGGVCISGAEVVSTMILSSGASNMGNVTLLKEEHATSTITNITLSKEVIESKFPGQNVTLIVGGMSDSFNTGIDIGHGARGYILAKQIMSSKGNIEIAGFLPTNYIDWGIGGYTHTYNLLTMYLGSNSLLQLPLFSKNNAQSGVENCE